MKKRYSIAGIILGIFIVIMGLVLSVGYGGYRFNGNHTSGYTFGADFYTEQYQATQNAANNVNAIGNYMRDIFDFAFVVSGLIIAAFGGVIICYFGCKLGEAKNMIAYIPNDAGQSDAKDSKDELPEI